MRKLILILALLLAPTLAKADSLTLPPLKQGFGWSAVDNQFNYFATADLIDKWGFVLGGGYAGRAENTKDKAVLTLTYEIANLQKLGVNVPIAKYIDLSIGAYAGYGNIQIVNMNGGNEFDWGILCNLVSIKF